MTLSPNRQADAAIIAIITAFFLAFFWPAFFSDMCFVSGDALVYSYPLREVAWGMIRQGTLPLWLPHLLAGFPLLAMAQLGLGYPLTWGYLFLPGHIAEEVYVLAPYLLTPIFIYAYLRTVGRSRLASLLAGLSFTYGGFMVSGLGQSAMFTNAVMWLPLMLIAIERARTGRFLLCLAGAGAAYAMSVLTGLGQGFLYAGLIAIGYGLFLSLAPPPALSDESQRPINFFAWSRWRPLFVSLGGIVLGAGVAAFQIFETMQAQRLSHRRALSYEAFSGGAFPPLKLWQSFINPIYHTNYETMPYVTLLAAVFALVAVVAALRAPAQHLRVFFWLLVALLSLFLMMGDQTPLYRLAYQIPILNLFRHPWRHAFEWSLAVSLLAAWGWDAAAGLFARTAKTRMPPPSIVQLIGALLLMACIAAGIVLAQLSNRPIVSGQSLWPTGLAETTLLGAKLGYTLLLLATAWWGWRHRPQVGRGILLVTTIVAACFWEQHLMTAAWWFPQNKPRSHFTQLAPPTRFLLNHELEQHRVYTSFGGGLILDLRRHDPFNLSVRSGLHDAGGYEPLLSQRYNQAFGSGWAFSTPYFGAPLDQQILSPRFAVLDLLNVKYLVAYNPPPAKGVELSGARFTPFEIGINLLPGLSTTLTGTRTPVDTLTLVTSMAHSGSLEQGAPVARVIIQTTDGNSIERELQAGVDTAEWAHERADVKSSIRHSLPRIFSSQPGDAQNSFPSLNYWTRFELPAKTPVESIELRNVTTQATVILARATLYDSAGEDVFLLTQRLPEQWRMIYDYDDVRIYENPRVLPRVWLAPHAEVVSEEEVLRRVRGEGEQPFDPRATVLLERANEEKLVFPQGQFAGPATARIASYEPHRLVIETEAHKDSVLVISEANYPGWEATVDGQPATIFAANYLLRGVVLPAGRHRLEMRYTAPAARRGAVISALSLLFIIGATISARIRKR